MKRIIFIIFFILMMFSIPLTAADIYIWKDKNGVENITSTPPPENAKVHHREKYQSNVKNDTYNKNNSSNNNLVNQSKELNQKKEEKLLCMRLFGESMDISDKIIKLIDIGTELSLREIDILKECTMNDSPKSVSEERTQDVRKKIEENTNEKKVLKEKQSAIERELKINNCK